MSVSDLIFLCDLCEYLDWHRAVEKAQQRAEAPLSDELLVEIYF